MPAQSRLTDLTLGVCDHGLPCCLGKNTKIYTDHGVLNIQDYEKGMKLWSSNGWQEPLAFHKHEYTGNLVEIELMGQNDKLWLTPDHQLLISRYKQCPSKGAEYRCYPNCSEWEICKHKAKQYFLNYDWVEAQNIKHKDYCIFPIPKQINNDFLIENFNNIEDVSIDELYYFLGIWFAEGCFDNSSNPQQIQITLHENEADIIDRVKEFSNSLGLNCCVYNYDYNNVTNLRIHSKQIAKKLLNTFKCGAVNKEIPPSFLKKNKKEILSFLLGWYHGDGWSDESNYYIVTSSRKAAYIGQYLFWCMGIPASLKQYNNYKPYKYKKEQCNDKYYIGWSIRKSKMITYDDKIFVPVKRMSTITYDDYVYNFTMKNDDKPEFCVPFLSHNCSHGCIGIRITGSGNTNINGKAASRAPMDLSIHTCPHCGINMCLTGSSNTNINGLMAHRVGDIVTEFCGIGMTITGSNDTNVN